MYILLSLVFQAVLISDFHLYCCEGICNIKLCTAKIYMNMVIIILLLWTSVIGTSTVTLSPLGMVSVCPGGQLLLTCERISGSFLYWTVSLPHLAMTRESIITSTGVVSTTALQFSGLHPIAFTITRTSSSPLTSQMMVNDVTTAMNGSTIHCSEDSNENESGVPMVTITIINEGTCIIHGV